MPIKVLDQNTINKIAAGEVIERPASIVKELVENAIDARATAITIEIKDGGISFVRITDNGCGISSNEIPMAFLRHSTSKIKSIEDLAVVSSLGFRGEALSSIAAVAQVELITKTKESFSGSRYVVEGGKETAREEVGAPDGTTFIVRNLFFNTPVRRKFLKSATTEATYVESVIHHLALSNPGVSFRFINNNQNKLHTSGNSNIKDIIYHIYGKDIFSNMLELNAQSQDIEVYGYIGKPVISRSNRSYENYYINGRYIKSSIITKAIEEAYRGFVMMHKYPFTVLHFKINPLIMDVNVHPSKMELRFSQNEYIHNFVMNSISGLLKGRELIPNVTFAPESNFVATAQYAAKDNSVEIMEVKRPEPAQKEMNIVPEKSIETVKRENNENEEKSIIPQNVKQRLPEPFETKRSLEMVKEEGDYLATIKQSEQMSLFGQDKLLDSKNRNRHTIIGQLFDTYWLIEFEDKLFIMDQHAAHEKVLFERMMNHLKEKKMDTQMISPPIILNLNMREEQILKEHLETFTRLGFEIEPFGGSDYKVIGLPANLPAIDNQALLIEILDKMVEENLSGNPEIVMEKVASMSCKAAVKGNHRLSVMEADTLIEELMQAENPYNCPHGRPTLISMTKYELEKKFKRIV